MTETPLELVLRLIEREQKIANDCLGLRMHDKVCEACGKELADLILIRTALETAGKEIEKLFEGSYSEETDETLDDVQRILFGQPVNADQRPRLGSVGFADANGGVKSPRRTHPELVAQNTRKLGSEKEKL